MKSTKKIALFITAITLVTKALGFIKNSALAYFFGTSPVVDAYVMTFSIVTVTFGWVAGLVGNLTPVFKNVESKKGRNKALDFTSKTFNYLIILVLLLGIVLEFIAPLVVKIVAPGFSGQTYEYTVYFFRIYLIGVFFFAICRFSQEFLNCNHKHLRAVVPGILTSSCCIGAIIVSDYIGKFFLIFGNVIALALESIIMQISSRKIGFRYRLSLKWDENIRALLVMAFPIFLSNTISEINTLIDKIFASKLESGIVSSLDYANTMKDFIFQIGTIALVTMIFPTLSKYWANNEIEAFKKTLLDGIKYLSIIYVPVIFGIIVVGDIVISIVFKRGKFGSNDVYITSVAFIIYSIGLIALVYRSIFLKAFYSMQKTKYILVVSSVNVLLNTVSNFVLVKEFGYIGLASATAISALCCIPIYFVLYNKAVSGVDYKGFFVVFTKAAIASLGMICILVLCRVLIYSNLQYGLLNQLLSLGILTIIGIAVYGLLCFWLKVNEAISIINYIKNVFFVGNRL